MCRNNHNFNNSTIAIISRLSFLILFTLFFIISASELKTDIEGYFTSIRENFDKLSSAPSMKGTSLTKTDRAFVYTLKKNQTYYSLIKTNSKGMIISEIIRSVKPERNFREVSNQRWFTKAKNNNEDYAGFLKEDNGRYMIFLGKPVFRNANNFVGAIAVKIDIWDCFRKFSENTEEPFQIRLGQKTLYNHRWDKESEFKTEQLDIPGVNDISIRYPASNIAKKTPATTPDSLAKEVVKPAPAATEAPKTKSGKFNLKSLGKVGKILIGLMVIALLALIFWFSRIIAHFRDYRLRKKIDKDDSLFD